MCKCLIFLKFIHWYDTSHNFSRSICFIFFSKKMSSKSTGSFLVVVVVVSRQCMHVHFFYSVLVLRQSFIHFLPIFFFLRNFPSEVFRTWIFFSLYSSTVLYFLPLYLAGHIFPILPIKYLSTSFWDVLFCS